MKKVCSKCKEEKDSVDFFKNKNKKDGLDYHCKMCKSAYYKKYYQLNRDKKLKAVKDYESKNPEYQKQYRIKNRIKINLKEKLKKRKALKELSDSHLRKNLLRKGIPITPETLKLQKAQLLIFRLSKQLNTIQK